MNIYRFYHNCVGWPSEDVFCPGGLSDLIDERIQISRRTFLRHVDRAELYELESSLSYERYAQRGLTMAGDYHVEYFRSTLHGQRVYGFRHSAIEYVFCQAKEGAA